MKRPKKWRGEAHVRIHVYEMRTPAWQTISVDARALLIELRALYQPSNANLVFLSVREAMRRLGIGQRRVQGAFQELLLRRWIEVDTPGGFTQKTRHATSYRLSNEASGSPGSVPSKAFMRWSPSDTSEKIGSCSDYTQ